MFRNTLLALCFLGQFLFSMEIEASSYSVARIENEKVYLQFETIRMTKRGIEIETRPGYFVPVPALFSDDRGYFLPVASLYDSGRSALAYCGRCEDWVEVFFPSKFCPRCGKQVVNSWDRLRKNGNKI